MLFNSIQYLLFLPLVVLIYWALPAGRWSLRPLVLLLASYYFYMSWMPAYGLLLAGLTIWNFLCGLAIDRAPAKNKRLIFIAAIAGNLSCLCLYKYTNFIIESVLTFLQTDFMQTAIPALMPGWHNSMTALKEPTAAVATQNALLPIILPLGISFFVFEFIHYLADVYKGEPAMKNLQRFALFAAFFPSQIAGPIKRFQDFDEQVLNTPHQRFDHQQFKTGMVLIVEGMFKKVVLGDNLAQLVQPGFTNAAHLGTIDAWISVLAFTLQIYYDFSGYTDIGRGSALLLGYKLPHNFNMPYIASSLSEFWHRWHISLSTWLRDYLYFPLGGSKSGSGKQARNLVITMLLGGLWHGASWHYVVWGAFHGLGLVATHAWNRLVTDLVTRTPTLATLRRHPLWSAGGTAITLFLVIIGWVVFRADNMTQAAQIYKAMFTIGNTASDTTPIVNLLQQSTVPVALLLYAAYQTALKLPGELAGKTNPTALIPPQPLANRLQPPLAAQIAALAGVALLIIGFAPHQAVPFIYFQF